MNLQLALKRQWFELTDCGEKKEDYREITPYWCNRLLMQNGEIQPKEFWEKYLHYYTRENLQKAILENTQLYNIIFKPFTTTTITLGCPKDGDSERTRHYLHAGIEIRTGRPEWGAEPDKLYFIIKHGDKL